MKITRSLFLLTCLFSSHWVLAQPGGEALELTPEQLDAAYSAEDAAREAAAWSNVIIDRGPADPIGEMSAGSDVVLRGTVSSQQVIYDANDLPFTHTTLSVAQVVKGDFSGSEITVVQEGGPAKDDSESIVIVSDARHFNIGEEELLFLEVDDGQSGTGSSVSVRHRFRVYEGKLYDEHGRGLILDAASEGPGYRLGWSRNRNPAPRFREIHIGGHVLSKNFSAADSTPDSDGKPGNGIGRGGRGFQNAVDVATFSAAVTQ